MGLTIQFHDQASFGTEEIDNKRTYWLLAAEPESCKAASPDN